MREIYRRTMCTRLRCERKNGCLSYWIDLGRKRFAQQWRNWILAQLIKFEKDRPIPSIKDNYIRRRGDRRQEVSDLTTLMASRNFNEQPLDKSCEPDRQEVPILCNLLQDLHLRSHLLRNTCGQVSTSASEKRIFVVVGISLAEGWYLLVRDFCGIATIKKRQTKRITANLRRRSDEISWAYRAKKEKIGGKYIAISSKLILLFAYSNIKLIKYRKVLRKGCLHLC